jgi:ribosome biogenesis GTPase
MSRREQKAWRRRQNAGTLRQVRKAIKRNRKPKRVRRKNWMSDDWDDLELMDQTESERIMPPGERERRRQAWSAAAQRVDKSVTGDSAPTADPDGQEGTVLEVSQGLCRVALDGDTLLCSLRGTLTAAQSGFTNVVAVGDQVRVSGDGTGRGVIEAIMPRRSALARPDVAGGHLGQTIVANADQLLIVSSWRDPLPWLELIDRYLITARMSQLLSVICLNKVDLASDQAACHTLMQPYFGLGCTVVYTSAVTGEGIVQLRQLLWDRTTVLAGMSGVGKSSLLGAVQPGLSLRIGEVSARRHEGRHTTSKVRLLKLDMGGFVADTPGIREFGLAGLGKRDLAQHYPEILALARKCRFADCMHVGEPGCAVHSALEQGGITKARYRSYRKILDGLPEQ